MASTVVQAFNEFLRDIVNLEKNQTDKGRNSRDWLVGQIAHFPDSDSSFPQIYKEKNIFFGSFTRRTKKRPLDDIDIMICLKANGSTYNEYPDRIEITIKDHAKDFESYINQGTKILNSRKIINIFLTKLRKIPQYDKAEIKRNLEAATLNLTSYDWTFDIVPCFHTQPESNGREYYLIPDGNGNWKKTDPRIDQERVSSINQSHKGNILNVIRIMKYWNNRATMPTIGSYLLETVILDYYELNTHTASDYVDIEIVNILKYISTKILSNVYDPKGIQSNINTLSYQDRQKISDRASLDYFKAVEARKFENDKKYADSIKKWGEIFGNEFPNYF